MRTPWHHTDPPTPSLPGRVRAALTDRAIGAVIDRAGIVITGLALAAMLVLAGILLGATLTRAAA